MRRIPLILAGLLCAVTAAPAAAPAAEKDQLEVTAKLVEIPSSFPPNDLYDYAYVMKYEVQGGKMDKQKLLVAHYNPRKPRSTIEDDMKQFVGGKLRSFKVGDSHRMVLDPDLKKIWEGDVIDDFEATDTKSLRYWCLKVDPAN